MTGEEKLIKILESAESAFYWDSADKSFVEKIADHLIENDVVPVVRCKDCKWQESGKDYEPYCNHWKSGLYAAVKDDDFCSYGERKDDASN